ncbi:MAG: S8 family serine peptidase, partial [Candidatus Hodarchaeota archaeon]
MSLGGGCGAPGVDPTDLLVDAATEMGITVVAAAGNEGPAPLRVGSPGTAKTAITVGAAIDPIHHKWAGGIIYGYPPYGELVYYPHDEKSIAYFSSRGPTSDGRTKPDVVATGYHTFGGLTPAYWPYTILRGSGTSFSCPQVAGEAALLAAYIRNNGLSLGPKSIKKAIMQGADPIEGFDAFEQGAGYINCFKSLEILKTMEESPPHCNYPHRYGCGCGYMPFYWWSPPVETLRLKNGKATVHDVTIDPLKYKYFAFWVSDQVDAIRITLSGVTFAPPEEQGYFGDGAYLYLSSAAREGVDDYLLAAFFGDDPTTDPDEFIFQVVSDFTFQPGVVRLVFEGDWYSLQPFHIDEMTIEVIQVAGRKVSKWMGIYNRGADVAGAQVSIFDGTIYRQRGKIREGEIDLYAFTIPKVYGMAIVELSWKKDWTRWATSDLDLVIFGPDGYINADGATGASPEIALVAGAGDYIILIDGSQVYWNRNETYILRIIYIADSIPKWESNIIALDYWVRYIYLPKGIHGLAIIWIYDYIFPYPYAADFVKV